jgi:hypothetical protein
MNFTGKTREQIARACADKTHDELVDLLFRYATVDSLLKPREIAVREGRPKRDVIRDMKAGEYVDPVLGAGYVVFGFNSIRATGAAVNARWKRFFVPVATDKKKETTPNTGLGGEKNGAKGGSRTDWGRERRDAASRGCKVLSKEEVGTAADSDNDSVANGAGANGYPTDQGRGGAAGSATQVDIQTGAGKQNFIGKGVLVA